MKEPPNWKFLFVRKKCCRQSLTRTFAVKSRQMALIAVPAISMCHTPAALGTLVLQSCHVRANPAMFDVDKKKDVKIMF